MFLEFMKKKLLKVSVFATVMALLSAVIMPGVSKAVEPRFNFLAGTPGDSEMFQGSNYTKSETVYKDPVSGTVGDTFVGLVYYHNGEINTTANNVVVKVTMPASTTNKQAVLTASISADNAETVTDTIINGQIVGRSGLTVNLDNDANLELVQNSVAWYPDKTTIGTAPTVLPNNQTGNSILSSGVNIGDIQGCWPYSGYVAFKFKTVEKPSANLSIAKTVKNLTKNDASFAKTATASNGDEVEYRIVVADNGSANLSDVSVRDILPADVTYESGSLKYSDTLSGSLVASSNAESTQLFGSGLPISTLKYGSANSSVYQFDAKVNAVSADTIVNTARATSGLLNANSSATITVLKPTLAPILSIQKDVRDFTSNVQSFTDIDQAYAGDTVEYMVAYQNSGKAPADNVTIKDVLPAGIVYLDGTTIISQNGGQEKTFIDGIAYSGINLGSLAAGTTGYLKFKASIGANIGAGEVLTNTVNIKSGDLSVSDTAKTNILSKTVPVAKTTPELPKTGPETPIVIFLLSFAGGVTTSYFQFKAMLMKKLALI